MCQRFNRECALVPSIPTHLRKIEKKYKLREDNREEVKLVSPAKMSNNSVPLMFLFEHLFLSEIN